MPDITTQNFTPPSGAVIQLAGWRDFETAARAALSPLGFADTGIPGIVAESNGAECYRIAPDKLWLRANDSAILKPALSIAAANANIAALDITHSRQTIIITGATAAELMSRLAPPDFTPQAFPANTFAQTAIQGVSVLIRRQTPQSFQIFTPRSWSQSIREFIEVNL